jgi:translocator protein
MQSQLTSSITRDLIRQGLNLVFSVGQFAAAILIFSGEFGERLFYDPNSREPLILPADYVFSIWGFIYPASIAYGIYQALPRNRENALLRRIGFPTAVAFFCIMMWSIVTLVDPIRLTVPLFFGALAALIYAVYQLSQRPSLSRTEKLFVVWPLSVFAAWCTVGTIANVSTSLLALGVTDFLLSELGWGMVMLVAAGLIGSFMTWTVRGNLTYALTIIWALVGIAIASIERNQNFIITALAVLMTLLVAGVLLRTRATSHARPPHGV